MQFIPILFSTMMVQAQRAGRKTMTRRVCKHQYWSFSELTDINVNGITKKVDKNVSCPYGQPGDVLWVRETLHQAGELGLEYVADNEWINEGVIPEVPFKNGSYRGNYAHCNVPNIHMPKWACRTFLEVVSVRVERLHAISQEDAKEEGVYPAPHRCAGWKNPLKSFADCYICAFKLLWNQINGERGQGWDANPFVWVIEFKEVTPSADILNQYFFV